MEIDGKIFLVEKLFIVDVVFVYVKKVDLFGNLFYDKSVWNINLLMVMVGCIIIVEVDEIVFFGDIDSENVMMLGVFVDYIVFLKGVNWKWVWE